MKITQIKQSSAGYPDKLRHLHAVPSAIKIAGTDLGGLLKNKTLGVVGSRKATSYGREVTEKFVSLSASRKIVIISGLAFGIDSIAHKAAITNGGKTIAVLPSGLMQIYPASHRSLAKNIIEKGGTLISEYDDEFMPRRESFIQRNRIIAALSDVLLIPEAAEKSGSLHTARFALELGKPVLAVPGNINSPTSKGTNNLIKSGAILVNSEQDVFDALGINPNKAAQQEIFADSAEELKLIKLIKSGISSGDQLQHESKLNIDVFQQTLTMLELKGAISPLGNNYWRLN